ncbi:MAG: ATP-binding protein [Acidimicrobiales bacterium]
MRRRGQSGLPFHEATTAQLGAAYPFSASLPLRLQRVLVGRDVAGGPFSHDPFDLYSNGMLTNPNITVMGQIGRGKSALVKTFLLRQAAFGRQVAVLDPKGEYGPLARALGTTPVKLSPAGATRINPLDGGGGGARRSPRSAAHPASGIDLVRQRRLTLLAALIEATSRQRLGPAARLAIEAALDASCARPIDVTPTLVDVVGELLHPGPDAAASVGVTERELSDDGRDAGLELRRLVHGDLAGIFDGETTVDAQHTSGALVVDLSEVYHSEALPALMVCAAAWLQSLTESAQSKSIFVVDEAWAVLSDVAVGRYLRSSWKLARARGVANVAICHRASDLASSGAANSEEARLAEGLLADSETVVCYAQPAGELAPLASLLGCSVKEIEYLPRLGRGVALWRVGSRSFLVEHLLGSTEREVVDTDQRLVAR